MEFRETARVIEISAPQVPRNSMEFYRTACVNEIGALSSAMEFHGTACVNEIGALQVPWSSMELEATALVIETGVLQVP